MDFMKVLDQAVREIKREVNLKVLNVPEIEQKVLDATSSEPWGPHGSDLSEIAQATKKFAECSMIMNVLWARLSETGANWRLVYKALTVIEYLIANGSERAVDDILEHTYKIASLSGFEYVEPNGKDAGINVRKKVETLVALVNDKEKMQAVRNKASANRDKYIGLSSSGITHKSSASSFGSSSFQSNYGGFGSSKEGDSFRDNKDSEEHAKETKWNSDRKSVKSKEGLSNEKGGTKLRKGGVDRAGGSVRPHSSKTVIHPDPVPLSTEDEFDDFDPRGSSTATIKNSNEVNLFGESLVGNLLDEPTSAPTVAATVTTEVDLFADATFESASPQRDGTIDFNAKGNIDFFSSPPGFPAAVPTNVDLFAASDFGSASDTKAYSPEPTNANVFDPFAASESGVPSEVPISTPESTKTKSFDPFAASESGVPSEVPISTPDSTKTKSFDPFAGIPMNNFEGADLFGAFTSHTEQASAEPPQNSTNNNSLNNMDQTSSTSSKPALKKGNFQVKSGIWADSLRSGLIDLNITGPKKTNLADIGIVGGLGDVSEDKDKGLPSSMYMGKAMGGGGTFSTLGQQQYRNFK